VTGKGSPDSFIGMIGGGDGCSGSAIVASGGGVSGGGIPMGEAAKHNSKTDCWVVAAGEVLDFTSFLSECPGGELLALAGKDATAAFHLPYPPDVPGKYALDAVIGKAGSGVAVQGDPRPWWVIIDTWFPVLAMLYETCATIFSATNIKISNDRPGLTRSEVLLILLIVIYAVGNLHVFKGPDGFHGYGYFYVRLCWTGFGLPANIIEKLILLSVMLHVFVGLERTWDMKLALVGSQGTSLLNVTISGLMRLTFMTILLFHFRFGDADQLGPFYIKPTPYIRRYLATVIMLALFWVGTPGCEKVAVRDIHRMEFEIFQSPAWCLLYLAAVIICSARMRLGWQQVVLAPALETPKKHHGKVILVGYVFAISIAMVYASCEKEAGRAIYHMELETFQSLAVIFCSTHMCWGWQSAVPAPALENPKRHHDKAILMGYVFAIFTAMVYASLLVYTHLFRHALVPTALGGHPRLREGGCAGHLPLGVRDFQSLDWCLFYPAAVIICSTLMRLGWPLVVPAPASGIPKKYHGKTILTGYVFAIFPVFSAMVYAIFPTHTHPFAMSLCLPYFTKPAPHLINFHMRTATMATVQSDITFDCFHF
jgi:hypothetical protein